MGQDNANAATQAPLPTDPAARSNSFGHLRRLIAPRNSQLAFLTIVMLGSGMASAAVVDRATTLRPVQRAAGEDGGFAVMRASIQATISNQIEAFRRADAAAAFAIAAPGIQRRFRDPDTFVGMVRQAYAPVMQPAQVEFLELTASPHGPIQKVRLVSAEGATTFAYYAMVLVDEAWRIAGCQLQTPGQAI